jgi:hypothetical protein
MTDLGSGCGNWWARTYASSTAALRNVPFNVYGVSYADVVVAEHVDEDNLFRRVYERGGHSTYRIFLVGDTSEQDFELAWKPVRKIGCTYERATDYLIAVDVPPETNIYEAYDALEAGQAAGVWDFEEGHCGHPFEPVTDFLVS